MENNIYLYQHRRLDTNQIFYVGIGKKRRAYSTKNRNNHWNNIVNKTNYTVEIISTNLTWQEACQKEIELINFYGRKDLGTGILVNMTNGGEGGFGVIVSDETKAKISNALKGKIVSDNTKLKLSTSAKERQYSEEYKTKCKLRSKSINISKETREKMAISKSCIILNTNTGIYYLGFKEAAQSCNKNKETLRCQLKNIYTNKTDFILC